MLGDVPCLQSAVIDAGLVGGSTTPQPGEFSMRTSALFLDEMSEFNRKTLEVLSQPLAEGEVTISRALPARRFRPSSSWSRR